MERPVKKGCASPAVSRRGSRNGNAESARPHPSIRTVPGVDLHVANRPLVPHAARRGAVARRGCALPLVHPRRKHSLGGAKAAGATRGGRHGGGVGGRNNPAIDNWHARCAAAAAAPCGRQLRPRRPAAAAASNPRLAPCVQLKPHLVTRRHHRRFAQPEQAHGGQAGQLGALWGGGRRSERQGRGVINARGDGRQAAGLLWMCVRRTTLCGFPSQVRTVTVGGAPPLGWNAATCSCESCVSHASCSPEGLHATSFTHACE